MFLASKMQRINNGKLIKQCDNFDIWLDGGHKNMQQV